MVFRRSADGAFNSVDKAVIAVYITTADELKNFSRGEENKVV